MHQGSQHFCWLYPLSHETRESKRMASAGSSAAAALGRAEYRQVARIDNPLRGSASQKESWRTHARERRGNPGGLLGWQSKGRLASPGVAERNNDERDSPVDANAARSSPRRQTHAPIGSSRGFCLKTNLAPRPTSRRFTRPWRLPTLVVVAPFLLIKRVRARRNGRRRRRGPGRRRGRGAAR